ncbi:unnamed protein product [Urochloa humidicola]
MAARRSGSARLQRPFPPRGAACGPWVCSAAGRGSAWPGASSSNWSADDKREFLLISKIYGAASWVLPKSRDQRWSTHPNSKHRGLRRWISGVGAAKNGARGTGKWATTTRWLDVNQVMKMS